MQFIEYVERCEYECLIGLYDLSVHDHLVENVVCFFDVIHDIQLADVLKIFIEGLHQVVDELQVGHFVLRSGRGTSYSRSRPTMK